MLQLKKVQEQAILRRAVERGTQQLLLGKRTMECLIADIKKDVPLDTIGIMVDFVEPMQIMEYFGEQPTAHDKNPLIDLKFDAAKIGWNSSN